MLFGEFQNLKKRGFSLDIVQVAFFREDCVEWAKKKAKKWRELKARGVDEEVLGRTVGEVDFEERALLLDAVFKKLVASGYPKGVSLLSMAATDPVNEAKGIMGRIREFDV